MESDTWRAFDKDMLMTNGLEKGSWGNKPTVTLPMEGLSLGSPAGSGRVDRVSQRKTQQGGAMQGCVGGMQWLESPEWSSIFRGSLA